MTDGGISMQVTNGDKLVTNGGQTLIVKDGGYGVLFSFT